MFTTRIQDLRAWHVVLFIVVWQVCDAVCWAAISYGDRILRELGG